MGVTVITFTISRVVPSNPAALWVGPRPTQEQISRAREILGLDKPLPIQYIRYISALLQGDFGVSVRTHQPILTDLRTYLPATLELVIAAMLIALGIGLPLGVLAGAYKGTLVDAIARLIAVACVSMPTFWLALIFQLIFFSNLHWLPGSGRLSTVMKLTHPIEQVTGFYLIDSALAGDWELFRDALVHLILPAFTLSTYALGLTIRMTRSSMVEVLQERYITTARAAGLPEREIFFKFALKNAIVPTLTVLGLSFVYSLTGAILIEVIFSWHGLGTYVTEAVLAVDFPVIIAVTIIVTVFYVFINLALDWFQAILDPRVTLG